MEDEDNIRTLRILRLPPALSDERREELFKRYGAVKTRTLRKSEKYTITFVEFATKENTDDAFVRLHQLPVKGRRLSVEYAKRNISDDKENKITDPNITEQEHDLAEAKVKLQTFLKKLNSWIPEHLLSQPPPPHIKYKYPAPTRVTLLRIAIQMVKVPAFYTQVLHLMNKMNLPPPFEGLEEEHEEIREAYDMEKYKDLFNITIVSEKDNVPPEQEEPEEQQQEDEEEDDDEESEMESDKEEFGNPLQHIIPEKRKKPQSKKRLKIPKFINPFKQPAAPSTSKKQRPQDIFELHHPGSQSHKVVLKPVVSTSKSAESTDTNFIVEASGNAEGFGLILPNKKDDKEDEDKEPKQDFITTEQLHDNRISTEDQRVLPVFKNYHPGKPSYRLYLKNLAKQVEENDLHFIYRRYVLPSSTGSESEYNVRLMQEGRMKGQAFITLPNVAQAQLALNETNGYILKDKPMVVQFAKVPKS